VLGENKDVKITEESRRSSLVGKPLGEFYEEWDNRAAEAGFGSNSLTDDGESGYAKRPSLTDTVLSEQSIDSIARFIGYGKVIACYSGMGYAEQQLQAKLHRAIYASDIMPHSSLRWTGDIEKDIKYEERRLDIPSKLREPYIPIDQMASLQYIEKQHPNCTGCTLLCFMPPTLKSQLGRTIEAFKQRGGRKIVMTGSLEGEEENDKAGDIQGWMELRENWDKVFESIASDFTPITLTMWELRED